MRNLVNLLLNKDEKKRPQVIDILRMNFVQLHMKKFVESQGKITLNPKLHAKKDTIPEMVLAVNEKSEDSLTPAEKARLRKAERAAREFDLLKNAAKDARLNTSIGKELQQQQFHGTRNSLRPDTNPA